MSDKIEEYCQKKSIPLIGKIPFDESVVKAMVERKTVIELPGGKAGEEIKNIWVRLEIT